MSDFEKLVEFLNDPHHPLREKLVVKIPRFSGVAFRKGVFLVRSNSESEPVPPEMAFLGGLVEKIQNVSSLTVELRPDFQTEKKGVARITSPFSQLFVLSVELIYPNDDEDWSLHGFGGILAGWVAAVKEVKESVTGLTWTFDTEKQESSEKVYLTLTGRLKHYSTPTALTLSSDSYLPPELTVNDVRNYVSLDQFFDQVRPGAEHHLLLYVNLVKHPDTDEEVHPGLTDERPWVLQLLLMSRHKSWVGNYSVVIGPSDMRMVQHLLYQLGPNNPIFELGEKVSLKKEGNE